MKRIPPSRQAPARAAARKPPCRHILCFARQLILAECRMLEDAEPGVLLGQRMPLHDLRVALRKLAVLLRAFRKPLETTSALRIEQALRPLGKKLGAARDLDVWLAFLNSHAPREQDISGERWQAFLQKQAELKLRQKKAAARALTSAPYQKLKSALQRLLLIEMPAAIHHIPAGSTERLAAKALRKALGRVREQHALCRALDPEESHQLRIAIRKARYLADYFGGALGGGAVARLGRSLKQMQSILGRIHDGDVWSDMLRAQNRIPAGALLRSIRNERKTQQAHFKKAWSRFSRPAFQKGLQDVLKQKLKPDGG